MKKVLIVSNDIVDENMGGVGVRYWEIAHSLAQNCLVTLAVPNETKLHSATVEVVSFDLQHGQLSDLASKVDVIIVQGFILHFHPYLRDLGIPIAVDLYVPSLLEGLVWHDQDDWNSWIPAYEEYLRVQLELLRVGDFFFCASERQRDYWLGWLHAQKQINPHTYRDDPSLRKLIDVVPFGLPDNRPPEHKPVLKGIHPGIPEDSFLLLWGGGLWDWLDPLTLIRAVALLIPHHPELRLFFMGTRHPDAVVSGMKMADQAIALSQQLSLFNRNVFFNDWVPYHERINYLQEADLGVVSHLEQIETHFSFRTRILDCIWVGLPIVTTQGDSLAEEVVKANVGLSVPPGDVSALAQAIETFIARGRGAIGQNDWEKIRGKFFWKNVVGPLLNFCERPCAAPDKSFYLTETERISRGKDEFLQKVIQDKDDFLQKVILAKDEFYNQTLEQKEQAYQQRISQNERVIEVLAEQRGRLQMALVQYDQHKIIRLYKHLFMGKKDLMIVDLIASIVVVNFNGKHFLPACLNAIVAQTLPIDAYEVIVSDNGSTDGSLEMLKQEYPWVRVIENGKNLGFAAGNNVAFKAARGKYLVAVNNDTAPLPDWLENLIKAAEENPQAGIINGHSRLFYDQLIVKLESETFVPGNLDGRHLGVMVSAVETGAGQGVVQYLDGFYGWEEHAGRSFSMDKWQRNAWNSGAFRRG